MGRTVCALLLLACAASAHAQRAPVLLEPGHWTFDAIRRLAAAGLVPAATDPAAAPITVQHARAVFARAATESERTGRHELAALAHGYAQLLDALADTAGAVASTVFSAGWTGSARDALGGEGYFVGEDLTGAQPLRTTGGPAVLLTAHGYLLPRLSWNVSGGRIAEQWAVPSATLGAAFGAFDAWAGRHRLHYGAGRGGAIVIGGGAGDAPLFAHRTVDTFEGIGINVREPFLFPSFLRVLGATRIEVVGGRMSRNGRVEAPWVVFGRLAGTPFSDRLTVGVNRGAIFGGEGNPVTAGRLLRVLVGAQNDGFENQVFSAVLRYRPPAGPLPLVVYTEFGADDAAGGLSDVPTYIAGFDIGALPGLAPVSLTIEHARYSGSCCGNPMWYRNVFFRGSWSDEGRLFAHPLGGHGYEWLASARIDLPQDGVMARADAFTRWRGAENLFAPERAGPSTGGAMVLELRRATYQLRLEGAFERADDWDLHRVAAMLSRTLH